MHDIGRIFRGLGIVAEQATKRGGPEVAYKMQRLALHASELLKNIVNNNSLNAEVTAENVAHKTSHPQTKDVIGFDSLCEADTIATNSTLDQSNTFQKMKEQSIPSTQFGRMVGFGGLAVRLAVSGVADKASSVFSGEKGNKISEETAERLADGLCRMRGAALKLGQMLSLQDDSALSPTLSAALERVKQAADYMPQHQLDRQLVTQLGPEWKSHFRSFESIPVAAASIGQVHRAVLLDGTDVAVKIQYPGVAQSIDSDLHNLKRIVDITNILPPGLFLDNIIKVASIELKAECNYRLEAQNQVRYRELIRQDLILSKHVTVPEVFPKLCSEMVLTSRWVPGSPVDKASKLSQNVRNAIARTMLVMTIRELFEWRFIQSDPNFANFLYDEHSRKVHLIDFGAAREYSKSFVDGYMKLVWAAANSDRRTLHEQSLALGFLTGDESQEFIDAHIDAGMVVGEPFLKHELYNFEKSNLTNRIGSYSGIFMKYRLTPPPTEAYSLHRKLAGAFYLCMKLKANISCRDILEETFYKYKF